MRKTYKYFLYFLAISFIVLACVQKNAEWRGNIEVENGVKIVKNPREPIYSGKVLSLKEELNLGGTSTDQYLFYNIKELDVDHEQNIYVLDWMEGCILVFDQNGKPLRTIGRKGQGPGELQRPMDISIFANQLMVHDLERCLSFFTLDGKFIRSVTSKDVLGIWDVYFDSLGNIVAQTSRFDFRNPKHLYRKYDHSLNMIYQFAESPSPSYFGPNNPFSACGSIAVDREDNIIFGYPDDYTIEIFNLNGRLVKKIEREYSPVKLSDQDRRKMKEDNPHLGNIDYPKYKPPFRRFFVDDEGRIYVGTWQKSSPKESYFYDIFDPEGRYLAQIGLKERPIMCRKGKLYSIEKNEEDFQCVKRYKMKWK